MMIMCCSSGESICHRLSRYDVPEDGLPSIDDWIVTFTSILLDGLELQREPLDVSADLSESNLFFVVRTC